MIVDCILDRDVCGLQAPGRQLWRNGGNELDGMRW